MHSYLDACHVYVGFKKMGMLSCPSEQIYDLYEQIYGLDIGGSGFLLAKMGWIIFC